MTQEHDTYLYHYTTLEAFISIVEKQEIWASNIFYLNDAGEFHWAITLARQSLKGEINEEAQDIVRQTLQEVHESLDEVKPGTITKPIFAWSLSEEGDDLSQWRAYCRNGGVAIGFRQQDLDRIAQQQGLGFAPRLVKCVYEKEEQRQLIRSAINEAIRAMPGGMVGKSMSPQEINHYRAALLQGILGDQPIKHETFSNEKEWRLVTSDQPGCERDERLGFRTHNGLIIPYWRFCLDPDKDKKIWRTAKISVGPSPHPHEMKAAAESLLKHYCRGPDLAFPGTVENSKVPYRYW